MEHKSEDQTVNNDKAGNPSVNQNPTMDNDVQQKPPSGNPDKTINDNKGSGVEHDNDYMAKLDEDVEENSFDNNEQSNDEAQAKNKIGKTI